MNSKVVFYPLFEREAKRLSKRYPSFKSDLHELVEELKQNPNLGTELSPGIHKVRMAIKSKSKGKSGGARVITLIICISDDVMEVGLHYIYDKSERSTVKDSEIRDILKRNGIM